MTSPVTSWAKGLTAITLFTEDLPATKAFYLEIFGLPVVYEDGTSAVFMFGTTMLNLLDIVNAPELVNPPRSPRGTPEPGPCSP